MNPMPLLMVLIVATWIVMAKGAYALFLQGRQITALYKQLRRPPYPITAEDVQRQIETYNSNPLQTIPFIASTAIRQQKILWSRYPSKDDAELDAATSRARRSFFRYLLIFFALVAMIVGLFVWAGLSGRIIVG